MMRAVLNFDTSKDIQLNRGKKGNLYGENCEARIIKLASKTHPISLLFYYSEGVGVKGA
jgi:hypothetical protein